MCQEISESKLYALGFDKDEAHSIGGKSIFVKKRDDIGIIASITLDADGQIIASDGVAIDKKGVLVFMKRINRVKNGRVVVFNK